MLCIRNHIYFIIYNTIFYVYIESAWLKLSILCVSFGAGTSLIHSYASHAIKLNMNSSHTLTYTHTLHTQTYDSSEIGMKHNNFASSFFVLHFRIPDDHCGHTKRWMPPFHSLFFFYSLNPY